jgi:hypothetical protein
MNDRKTDNESPEGSRSGEGAASIIPHLPDAPGSAGAGAGAGAARKVLAADPGNAAASENSERENGA